MTIPCALITSCSLVKPEELVKEILCDGDLPEPISVFSGVEGYLWHIDTKYYTADVLLSTVHSKTIGDQEFADRVHAFLLLFDANEKDSLDKVESWLPFVRELEPPVQLLITESFSSSTVISRHKALTWCLDQGFELVELRPEALSGEDSDEDDDFVETVGVDRVVEAMKAHMWPNLKMKEKPDVRGAYFKQLMAEEAARQRDVTSSSVDDVAPPDIDSPADVKQPDLTSCEQPDSNKQCVATSMQLPEHGAAEHCSTQPTSLAAPAESAGGDDGAAEDDESQGFDEMFQQLHVMKDRVSGLPEAERRRCAEEIVTQFWRAIGGDEGELESLDSDSD